MFALHPTLAGDTHVVTDLILCRVLLMNDARYPWLILVPRIADLTELFELSAEHRAQLTVELDLASRTLLTERRISKINVASLGNLVPQLHVHVIGRHSLDPAWPGPVWGHSTAEPYADSLAVTTVHTLKEKLQAGFAGQ